MKIYILKSFIHTTKTFVRDNSYFVDNELAQALIDSGYAIADKSENSEIEIKKGETHIQWRVTGEESWHDIVSISELKGDKGETGQKGKDGFGTEEQYNLVNSLITDLTKRVADLESKSVE